MKLLRNLLLWRRRGLSLYYATSQKLVSYLNAQLEAIRVYLGGESADQEGYR